MSSYFSLCLSLLCTIGQAAEVYIACDDSVGSPTQGSIYVYDSDALTPTVSLFTTMPAGVFAGYVSVSGTIGVLTNNQYFLSSLTVSNDIYTFNTQHPGVPPAYLTNLTSIIPPTLTTSIFGLALTGTKGYGIFDDLQSTTPSSVIFQFSATSTVAPTVLFSLPPDEIATAIAATDTTGYVVIVSPSLFTQTVSSSVYTFDLTSVTPTLSLLTAPLINGIGSIAVSGGMGCLLGLPAHVPMINVYTFDPIFGGTPALLTSVDVRGSAVPTGITLIDSTTGYISGFDADTQTFLELLQFSTSSTASPVIVGSFAGAAGVALTNHSSSTPPPPSPAPAPHRADTSRLAYSIDTVYEAQLDVIKGLADHLSEQRLERSFPHAPEQLTAAYGKPHSKPLEYCSCPPAHFFSFWVDGLASYFHQKERHQVTPFSAVLGGAILGLDYKGWLDAPVGGGLAVTHSGVDENSLGHASVNQEYAFLYGSWVISHFYADVALWGCYAQIDNVRTIGHLNATSETTAWLVTPHLELGGEVTGCGWMIEPFAMLDWPSSWEQKFREHAAGSENVKQKKQHASLLRTEAGLRFYENIQYEWGRLVFLEKASYVNKKPFHVGTVTTSFLLGAPGSLTVDTLTSTQNLGVGEFAILFEPKKRKRPYVSLSYQGEFGSTFQSHQGMITLGKNW
jgi:hypothetical protein